MNKCKSILIKLGSLVLFIIGFNTCVKSTCIPTDSIKVYNSDKLARYLESAECDSILQVTPVILKRIIPYLYKGEFDSVSRIFDVLDEIDIVDSLILSEIESNKGNFHYIQDQYPAALVHFKKGKDLLPKGKTNVRKYIISLINISKLESELYNFDVSLDVLDEGLEMLKEYPDPRLQYEIYNHLGTLSKNQNQLDKAKKYYTQASETEGIENNEKYIAISNVVNIHSSLEEYDSVIAKVTPIIDADFENSFTKALLYKNLCNAYIEQDQPEIASIRLNEYKNYITLKNDIRLSELYDRVKANYLNHIGAYAEASKLYKKSYRYNLKKNKVNNTKRALRGWIEAEVSTYDPRLGQRFLSFSQMTDSLYESKLQRSINKWEVKYNTSEKENEISTLKLIDEKKNILISNKNKIIKYGLVGLSILSILLYLLYSFYKKVKRANSALETEQKRLGILNREMKHRQKGYLNMAVNLLMDQREHADQAPVASALLKSEQRMRALTAVNTAIENRHQDISTLITSISEDLVFTAAQPVNLDIQIPTIDVDDNQMMTLALITNELIMNSLKYAFDHTDEPAISITLHDMDTHIEYNYMDNGSGLDGTIKGTGLGTQIVSDLILQIRGQLSIDTTDGYLSTISFPKKLTYV